MVSKKSPHSKEKDNQEELKLDDALTLIDKVTKNAEEKILLEDSIKNIIKGTDNFLGYIKKMDLEKRKELLVMYNKVLDGTKQKALLLD
ncbi:MAG: hypothetical protein H0X50_11930 [Nitrosopumilus sp.]|nr:hypothetical protein [Nitrosopumilus sp.]